MKTLTSREVCERLYDKIGSFVSAAFDHAPNEFKALYRTRVNDFAGGFRRIDMVPKALLTKRIAKDSAADPAVALLIMRNWFRSQTALRENITAILQLLGYEIVEPDFEKDRIACQSLKASHIHIEENASYFFPERDITEFSRLDATVMAALLGWFPNTNDDEVESKQSPSETASPQ